MTLVAWMTLRKLKKSIIFVNKESKDTVMLKKAELSDFNFFFEIKSEEDNIFWCGHVKIPERQKLKSFWEEQITNNRNRKIYIIWERMGRVGYMYVDYADDYIEISIGVSLKFSGKGYATKAVKELTDFLNSQNDVCIPIVAYIREDNYKSQHVFGNASYEKSAEYVLKSFGEEKSLRMEKWVWKKTEQNKLEMDRRIAIIPARSGSKGLTDKNIKDLCGKPLMAYSIEAAIKSGCFDEIFVSTDSAKYAKIAEKYGADASFLRSAEMSSDTAGSWDAVIEVLNEFEKRGKNFDTIMLLQPTSPLRTAEDIINAYNLFHEKNADAVTSVCEVDHSPLWCMNLADDLSLRNFREGLVTVPRQHLPVFYRLNGAIYIRKISYFRRNALLKEDNEYAFIMDRNRSIDIDTAEDFYYAEFLIKNNKIIR